MHAYPDNAVPRCEKRLTEYRDILLIMGLANTKGPIPSTALLQASS